MSGKTALLAAGVLGHSFGALAHCVFGQFTGKKQTDSRLDLARGDVVVVVVVVSKKMATPCVMQCSAVVLCSLV